MDLIAPISKDGKVTSVDDPALQSSVAPLDTSTTSPSFKTCSTLQFSFEDLRKNRLQRLSRMQSTGYVCGIGKIKRCGGIAFLIIIDRNTEFHEYRDVIFNSVLTYFI